LILLWIATADGRVDERELANLDQSMPEQAKDVTTQELLTVLRAGDVECLHFACTRAARLTAEHRRALLDFAIDMSAADKRLDVSELHILRFLCDCLKLGSSMLKQRYLALLGQAIPEPGDPGSELWWATTGPKSIDRSGETEVQARTSQGAGRGFSREQACKILGVPNNASDQDIRLAYEELSRTLGPERAKALGDAALAHSRQRIESIESAYQALCPKDPGR
jgi:DnaJ-domain-containing protein 1